MFEITPSTEFSAWFELLSPAMAEEVACALDLLAAAGTALGPSHVSRALLWFDGNGGGVPLDFDDRYKQGARGLAREVSRRGADAQELLLWRREVVRCLESEAFRERLAQLEPKSASLALAMTESLKRQLLAAHVRLALEAQAWPLKPRVGWVRGQREDRSPSARFVGHELPEASLFRTLKEAFFEVLRLVGLEPMQLMNSASGLCELTIVSTEPQLHVLFGLDAPAERIVALLGEPLTRSYYGDSVLLAERRWREYCTNDARSVDFEALKEEP